MASCAPSQPKPPLPHSQPKPPLPQSQLSQPHLILTAEQPFARIVRSCADHIGFHLFEWAQNFLACCRRLLSCSCEVRRGGGLTLHYEGREIALTCTHMGIDPPLLLANLPTEPVTRRVAELRREHSDALVICSIDLLEGLKGVRLRATESLLSPY